MNRRLCAPCSKQPPIIDRIAAAFDYAGPPATLIRKLKYAHRPYLAKGAGAYLAAQFLKLDWPLPDLIIPVPISLSHKFERGFNQCLLLAEAFASIIEKPVADILRRRSGDYSQAGLTREQRTAYDGSSLYLKSGVSVCDKTILLIDDVMTTGSTVRKCGEVLRQGCPSSIYALVVCKALL